MEDKMLIGAAKYEYTRGGKGMEVKTSLEIFCHGYD